MKISTVSKKVLASALSAAMVVAFAPTVAFGATGDKIEVAVDINGGTGTVPTYSEAVVGGSLALPTDVKYGTLEYTLAGWYYDANGDGKISQGNGDKAWTSTDTLPDQASIAFKAFYNNPVLDKTVAYGDETESTTADQKKFALTIPKTDKAYSNLKVTMYGTDGGVVASISKITTSNSADTTLEFGVNVADVDGSAATISSDAVKEAGEFTFKLSDASGDVLSTQKTSLYKVTTVGTDKSEKDYIRAEDGTVDLGSGYYKTEDGQIITNSYVVKGNAKLTQVKTNNGIVYDASYIASARYLQFKYTTPANTAEVTASYALTVTDPAGDVVYKRNLADDKTGQAAGFTFNQNSTASNIATKTEVAGTYTITLTRTVKGGEGIADTVDNTSCNIVLSEVKFDAGEASFTGDAAKAAYSDTFTSADTIDLATYNTFVDANNKPTGNISAPAGTTFDYWALDGAKIAKTDKVELVAGATNVITPVYKAIDYSAYIAKPALESVTKQADGKYTVKVASATAGAALYYSKGATPGDPTTPYDPAKGIVDVEKTDAIKVIAQPVAGATPAALTHASQVLTLAPAANNGDIAAYKGIAKDGSLEYYVGKTTGKWAAIESIAAAVTAGNEAVDAVVFDTEKNLKSLAAAQSKAVHDAVLAEAKAQLAPYEGEAIVIVGDKAYTISSKSLKSTKEALATMEAYITGLGDKATAADYSTAIAKYVTETNKALKGASEADVTAADITAAQDVTAALKAAATAEDAQAALDAYEALTDDQKALVATADVLAAHAVIDEAEKAAAEEEAKKAAEEAEKAAAAALVKEQDKAAVNLVNNPKTKTVKLAKAKKAKTTLTYKSQVSASGNVVTYAKVSGNAKITVAANGKVTLKKVTKAGTYKAKVLVTCGEQTRTVTAKFIVK